MDAQQQKFTIINGNCIEAVNGLEAGCVDLIFADPPYWMRVSGVLKLVESTEYNGCSDAWENAFSSLTDYVNFTRGWLAAALRRLKKPCSLRLLRWTLSPARRDKRRE